MAEIPTVKMYKGDSMIRVNEADVELYRTQGYSTTKPVKAPPPTKPSPPPAK